MTKGKLFKHPFLNLLVVIDLQSLNVLKCNFPCASDSSIATAFQT